MHDTETPCMCMPQRSILLYIIQYLSKNMILILLIRYAKIVLICRKQEYTVQNLNPDYSKHRRNKREHNL